MIPAAALTDPKLDEYSHKRVTEESHTEAREKKKRRKRKPRNKKTRSKSTGKTHRSCMYLQETRNELISILLLFFSPSPPF